MEAEAPLSKSFRTKENEINKGKEKAPGGGAFDYIAVQTRDQKKKQKKTREQGSFWRLRRVTRVTRLRCQNRRNFF